MFPTPSVAELLEQWGVATPIGIWSRGINHDRFSPARRDLAWRRARGIGDDEMAIGFLGRLVKEKGLDIFAEVVTDLARRGVPHKVLVIGEGPARRSEEHTSELQSLMRISYAVFCLQKKNKQ